MNFRISRIGWAASILYGVAIVIAIFVGGLLPVLIVGAVILAAINTVTGRLARDAKADRRRNRDND